MTLSISSALDGGNIELVAIHGDRIDLEIVKDHLSDFYQWFYFRLTGGAGRALTLRLVNCAGAAYPDGWTGYRACVSDDREQWTRAETSYADGVLSIALTPASDSVWIAYFAPYTMERHHELVAEVAAEPGVEYRSLGQTLDGQEIDYFRLAGGVCRSGSTPASIPARRWPNGGWRARSSGCSTRPIRSLAGCARRRRSISSPI